jgi:ribosomal protein L4
MLKRLGVAGGRKGKALLVDVAPQDAFALSVRNVEGIRFMASNRLTARDVMDTRRVVLTQAALEKLQAVLG